MSCHPNQLMQASPRRFRAALPLHPKRAAAHASDLERSLSRPSSMRPPRRRKVPRFFRICAVLFEVPRVSSASFPSLLQRLAVPRARVIGLANHRFDFVVHGDDGRRHRVRGSSWSSITGWRRPRRYRAVDRDLFWIWFAPRGQGAGVAGYRRRRGRRRLAVPRRRCVLSTRAERRWRSRSGYRLPTICRSFRPVCRQGTWLTRTCRSACWARRSCS